MISKKKTALIIITVITALCTELCGMNIVSAYDHIETDNDCGDFSFMNSRYINDVNNTYKSMAGDRMNFVSMPYDNKITYNRYDRFNPERENDYIIMEKNTGTPCHFDTVCRSKYKYVYMAGSFMFDKFGSSTDLFYIRDDKTNSTNCDIAVCRVTADGTLTILDDPIKKLNTEEWCRLELAFDLEEHTLKCFYNGEEIVSGKPINNDMDWISVVRTNISAAGSDTILYIDNYEIVGMKKPYTGSADDRSSVFPDDKGFIAYLSDKVAFHTYADNVTLNGTDKYYAKIPSYYDNNNNEYYIAADTFNYAFGFAAVEDTDTIVERDITIKSDSNKVIYKGDEYYLERIPQRRNDHIYIPVKDFAEKVMGLHTFDDGNGMIILSESVIDLDIDGELPEYRCEDTGWDADINAQESEIKGLNNYLFFRRPSKEALKELFYDNSGAAMQHPRIIATNEDFSRIKKLINEDPMALSWYNKILNRADRYVNDDVIQYSIPDGRRLLATSRSLLSRAEYLSFAYKMTSKKKYLKALWANIDAAIGFPDWNTSHIIDTAEMAMGVALAYDWVYDSWTDEQRELMEKALVEKALVHFSRGYYGWLCGGGMIPSARFPKWKSNFNTVVNGAAAASALAIADVYPDTSFDVVEKAIRSIEYTIRCFPDDGAWIEGGAYWDYTISYLSKMIESLKSVYGTDFGLTDHKGLKNSGIFAASIIGNAGINNYHDTAENANLATSRMSWYSQMTDIKGLFSLRKEAVSSGRAEPDPYDMIYMPTDTNTGYDDLPIDYSACGLESFSMRGSWTDKNGLYVSAHGGPTNYYHSQADVGAFVFDYFGERWASDLGAEDYAFINTGGYSFETIYRRRAEAHNVVVFDPDKSLGQDWDGFARLTDFRTDENSGYAVYDMQDIYKTYTESYKRGFYIGDYRRSLTVRDEIDLSKAATLYWFMETPADVTKTEDGHGVVLSRNNKTMNLDFRIDGADEYSLDILESEPMQTSPQLEGQSDNSDYKRIAIKIEAADKVDITVKLYPDNADTEIMDIPISKWKLESVKTYLCKYDFEDYTGGRPEEFGGWENLGILNSETIDAEHGRSVVIGIDDSYDDKKANGASGGAFIDHPMGYDKCSIGFDFYLDSLSSTFSAALRSEDAKLQTIINLDSTDRSKLRVRNPAGIKGTIFGIEAEKWYHLSVDIDVQERVFSVSVFNQDGTQKGDTIISSLNDGFSKTSLFRICGPGTASPFKLAVDNFSVTADYIKDGDHTNVVFGTAVDEEGKILNEIKADEDIIIPFTAVNHSGADDTAAIVAALFDNDDRLLRIDFKDLDIASGAERNDVLKLHAPGELAGGYIRVFRWNSLIGCTPIGDSIEIYR